ncbi:hypothetical protein EJB05_14158, partial [Eragrostis curvula]
MIASTSKENARTESAAASDPHDPDDDRSDLETEETTWVTLLKLTCSAKSLCPSATNRGSLHILKLDFCSHPMDFQKTFCLRIRVPH